MKIMTSLLFLLFVIQPVQAQSVWFGSDLSLLSIEGEASVVIEDLDNSIELISRTSDGGAWIYLSENTSLQRISASGDIAFSVPTETGLAAMAVDATGAVWATRPGMNDVIRIAPSSFELSSYVVAGVPHGITVDGLGRVWVTCSYSNEVQILSTTGEILQTIPVGFFPTGISATHDFGVWVAEKQGLRRLDSAGNSVWSDVAGIFPIGVTTDTSGRGWFTCQVSHQVVVVSDLGIDMIIDVPARPLGVAAHVDGSVSVLSRLGDTISRISGTGELLSSYSTSYPTGKGDLSGIQLATVVAPTMDFDEDGIPNQAEVFAGTNPYVATQIEFVRGDVDRDGSIALTDALLSMEILFLQQQTDCLEALDVNDDGSLDLADPIRILGYLFLSDSPPESPFPEYGPDPTPQGGFTCNN